MKVYKKTMSDCFYFKKENERQFQFYSPRVGVVRWSIFSDQDLEKGYFTQISDFELEFFGIRERIERNT